MVHYNIGIVYKRKRDLDKAREEFLKDVAVEPDVAYNYDELGTMSLAQEQNAEARRYFEQALRRNSQIGTSWFGLAKIDKAEKRYADALKALDSAGAIDPKSASVHYLRAQILMQLGPQSRSSNGIRDRAQAPERNRRQAGARHQRRQVSRSAASGGAEVIVEQK